jgi:hypothetical protein
MLVAQKHYYVVTLRALGRLNPLLICPRFLFRKIREWGFLSNPDPSSILHLYEVGCIQVYRMVEMALHLPSGAPNRRPPQDHNSCKADNRVKTSQVQALVVPPLPARSTLDDDWSKAGAHVLDTMQVDGNSSALVLQAVSIHKLQEEQRRLTSREDTCSADAEQYTANQSPNGGTCNSTCRNPSFRRSD